MTGKDLANRQTVATSNMTHSRRLGAELVTEASRYVEAMTERGYGRLAPGIAEGIRAAVDGIQADGPATPAQALQLAERLVGCYRAKDFADNATFAASLTKIFATYPYAVGCMICDPVHGLPGRMAFPPSLAEVNQALAEVMPTLQRALRMSLPKPDPRFEAIKSAHEHAEWVQSRSTPEAMAQRKRVSDMARAAVRQMPEMEKEG